MKKEIQSIECTLWSKPDENHRVHQIGMMEAEDVFNKLYNHLKDERLLPDDYFIFNDNFYDSEKEIPRNYTQFSAEIDWGGSEGIYLNIYVNIPDYVNAPDKRISFGTGKTLSEDGNAFINMSRIQAECMMFLNGNGRKISYNKNDIPVYYLKSSPYTPYVLLESKGNDAILKRITSEEVADPTPYIIAHDVKFDGNIIEWGFGSYLENLSELVDKFPKELMDEDKEVYGYSIDVWSSFSEEEKISIQDRYEYDLQHPDQFEYEAQI